MKKKTIFWTLLFLGIVFLTQLLHLAGFQSETFLFGFPSWLFYFIILHLAFIVALYYFARAYYKNDGE